MKFTSVLRRTTNLYNPFKVVSTQTRPGHTRANPFNKFERVGFKGVILTIMDETSKNVLKVLRVFHTP